MGKAYVETTTFLIAADAPVVTIPPIAIPAHSLTVSSSGNVTAGGKKAALKTDMEAQTPFPGIGYINPPYVTPGVLLWDGDMLGSQESTKCTKDGNGVIVDDTNNGTTNFTVVTPAINPGPPAPDPSTSYPGTWTEVVNPNTVLTTNE